MHTKHFTLLKFNNLMEHLKYLDINKSAEKYVEFVFGSYVMM